MNDRKFCLALVTGASSGIGFALCHLLARQGIDLIIHGRDRSKLQALADELSGKVAVAVAEADLADPAGQKKMVDLIKDKVPDLIINNAGYGFYGSALKRSTEQELDMIQVNGMAAIRLTIEGAKVLVSAQREGTILNVSSVAAFFVFPEFAAYSASKALLSQFSEAFDEETRPYGVRVLVSCPGVVATRFRRRAGGKELESRGERPMTADYAASQIWNQILSQKKVNVFDFRYRLALFFSYLLPKKMLTNLLKKSIQKLYTERQQVEF